jgi:serine/threonine-protein kinase RsbT
VTRALEAQLNLVLGRYVPDVVAQSIVRRVTSAASRGDALDRRRLADELRASVRLFVEPALQPQAQRDVDALDPAAEVPLKRSELMTVKDEADVCKARLRARELAVHMRTSAFGAQRASTAVSELARNMVLYASGGTIELLPDIERRPRMTVRAADRGPGIANVSLVLSGNYRSTTGLGRGLYGVKRLSSRFDLRTGSNGTSVEAVIEL